ncbi:MAG TPA: D-aminoacyl-tRNA deacylase [Woeseiaceae bacterium]|jgi:D-tyrosyl-tRNA(Tyr) deacylase
MIGLLQRVTESSISVDGKVVARIGKGLLVFVAVQPQDTETSARRLAERILGYRVFPDQAGRMNLSLIDTGSGLLLVPQFTLAADTRKGTRASFTGAAGPESGRRYFGLLLEICGELYPGVQSGVFGADMQVALINDGPVTLWLES